MLRKLLWSGLYAGLAAGGAVVARLVATRIWKMATGEDPEEAMTKADLLFERGAAFLEELSRRGVC